MSLRPANPGPASPRPALTKAFRGGEGTRLQHVLAAGKPSVEIGVKFYTRMHRGTQKSGWETSVPEFKSTLKTAIERVRERVPRMHHGDTEYRFVSNTRIDIKCKQPFEKVRWYFSAEIQFEKKRLSHKFITVAQIEIVPWFWCNEYDPEWCPGIPGRTPGYEVVRKDMNGENTDAIVEEIFSYLENVPEADRGDPTKMRIEYQTNEETAPFMRRNPGA